GHDGALVSEPKTNAKPGGVSPHPRQPAQPNQRIEAYAAPGPVGFLDRLVGHADNVRFRCGCSTAAVGGGRDPRPPMALASCAPLRHMCACAPAISDMPPAAEPALAVDPLVEVYQTSRAVGGHSFAL